MLNVVLFGQKWFGSSVLKRLSKERGVNLLMAIAKDGDKRMAAAAELCGVRILGNARPADIPTGTDLIISAHSHAFISEAVRLRSKYGGIGFHPSLLPVHRGRDAIRWAVKMRERVTGGTVYRLSNKVDGGNIIDQRHVFIRQDEDATELWRREIAPMGVDMLISAVCKYRDEGFVNGIGQDESLATWEPSIDRPPLHRPDLPLIGYSGSAGEPEKLPDGLHPWTVAYAEDDEEYRRYVIAVNSAPRLHP